MAEAGTRAPSTASGGIDYTPTAKLFHWLVALLVVVTVPVGLTMTRIGEGGLQNGLFTTHKTIGSLLIVLIVARIAWRATHTPPSLAGEIPDWMQRVSWWNHMALYTMLVVMVVSGYVYTVAGGFPVEAFSWLGIPPLVPRNEAVSGFFESVHLIGKWVLIALIALHVAAALYHAFGRRDRVFWRMWF